MHDPNLHLFLDDREVKERLNLSRFINRPKRFAEPVVRSDQPWEKDCKCVAWGSVIKEKDGLLRMWYFSFNAKGNLSEGESLDGGYAYAESRDGIHWTKPSLGLVDWKGSKENNFFFTMGRADVTELARRGEGLTIRDEQGKAVGIVNNWDGLTVIRDDHEADPQKRYKLFANMQDHRKWAPHYPEIYPDVTPEQVESARNVFGQYMITSPDGFQWTREPVFVKRGTQADYMMVNWDERNGQWLLNERPTNTSGRRTAGLTRSKDLRNWSEVETVFDNDETSGFGRVWEWHAGITSFNYGNQDIGFLERWGNSEFGDTSELISHRDGEPYVRVAPGQLFLDSGPEGSFDRRLVYSTHNPPIQLGDKLYIYYTGTGQDSLTEGAIGVAIIGLDRFAGLAHQRRDPGVVRTIPQMVAGSRLQINVEPLMYTGEVRVGLCNPDNTPIPGFSWDECIPIKEDAVRTVVEWNSGRSIAELKGTSVIVEFKVISSVLYSYRWDA